MTANATHVIRSSLRRRRRPLATAKITAYCALATLAITGYIALLVGLLYALIAIVVHG